MKRIQNAWHCVLETPSELGEGAFWDSDAGVLYWIDILRGEIHRFEPVAEHAGPRDRALSLGAQCGTVVPRASGGLVAALPTGLVHLDPNWTEVPENPRLSGAADSAQSDAPAATPPTVPTTPLVSLEEELDHTRANDGKCDPRGRLWQGTMGFNADQPAGSLYRIDCDREVRRLVPNIRISNGLCWDLSAGVMYYIDTPTQRVDAFDFDAETGSITNRRTAVRVDPELGAPDGMTIDENGELWIAMWDGAAVTHWNPESGELLEIYELPVSRVTSCAFGGPDRSTLYVTTARAGLSAEQRAAQSKAGSLFTLEPGVSGPAMASYCG
jgi:sugar lactone lactonase YvrE